MSLSRSRLLAEMGIKPIWRLRSTAFDNAGQALPEPVAASMPVPVIPPQASAVQGQRQPMPVAVRALSDAFKPPPETLPVIHDLAPIAGMDWDALDESIRNCTRCDLCKQRKQAVPGTGDRNADWLFVGEGPGAEEDARGEPFVGPAGKLLDAMLASIGLRREEKVYIANAVKCRPPGNRTPDPDEIQACLPYLQRQIELLQPKMIMALGRPAAQSLLAREVKIGPARGKRFEYKGIPVVVSYHPAYLLRTPADKSKAWEDLCLAVDLVAAEAGHKS